MSSAVVSLIMVGLLLAGGYFVYTQYIIPAGGLDIFLKNTFNVPSSKQSIVPSLEQTSIKKVPLNFKQPVGLVIDPSDPSHSWAQKIYTMNKNSMTDTITITKDNGNQIPDKSWMLYIFINFISGKGQAELDLICQFDGQTYFEAVFTGSNRYRFKMPVVVGHKYQRITSISSDRKKITYALNDLTTNQHEQFVFPVSSGTFNTPQTAVQGVEYHNIGSTGAFPNRYEVTITKPVFK